jgi:FkbM family methyltransferase
VYRTGDLARSLADGNVEFLGRMDDQIKLHGNRIEPAEIESALRSTSGIRDALVLPRDDGSGTRRLIGYIVPTRSDQPLWDTTSIHILPDGTAVAHLNRNETEYIYREVFVLQAYLRHGITVRDGDCIVDAGANIGLFTVFASRLASDLRILAFEPNPSAFECLRANAATCGADVTCLPVGLSRENKLAELTSFAGLSLLSGLYADATTERDVVKTYVENQRGQSHDDRIAAEIGQLIDERLQATTVAVELKTLSRVIAEQSIDRIDLLKINVEKSELDVLLGLSEADWTRIRQLVIEVDTSENLLPIEDLLKRHGFEVAVEQDELLRRTDLCYVYASRHSATSVATSQPAAAQHPLSPPDQAVLTPATLRAALRDRLPHYMIPSAFVLMERFPLTPNGKIDRQALPECSLERSLPAPRDFEAPRSETEKSLAAIWSEVLSVGNIGVADDFFDLGGQSLTAIRTVSRIRDTFRVDLSLRNVFEQPTLRGLAEIIDGLRWVSTASTETTSGDREEIAL